MQPVAHRLNEGERVRSRQQFLVMLARQLGIQSRTIPPNVISRHLSTIGRSRRTGFFRFSKGSGLAITPRSSLFAATHTTLFWPVLRIGTAFLRGIKFAEENIRFDPACSVNFM